MRQDFLSIIKPENRGSPIGMLTYVGNDRSADVRAYLDKTLGPLAPVPPAYHISHMFASSFMSAKIAPLYEHPAIVTFSYMKKKERCSRTEFCVEGSSTRRWVSLQTISAELKRSSANTYTSMILSCVKLAVLNVKVRQGFVSGTLSMCYPTKFTSPKTIMCTRCAT